MKLLVRGLAPLAMLILLAATYPAAAHETECVDGTAEGYACSHVDLLAHLSPAELGGIAGESLNDVWGWTDDAGTEYALVGMIEGTAFVRLPPIGSEAEPELLGRLPASDGANGNDFKCRHDEGCGGSSWRDIKTYAGYAYIVSEADGHGLQVFDLRRLVDAPAGNAVFDEDGRYDGFGHAHNLVINEASGHAFAVGNGNSGSNSSGGLLMLDLNEDPVNPVALGRIDLDGYVHDAQCIDYDGPDTDYRGRELCFGADEDTLTVFDVEEGPAAASLVARVGYAGAEYTHQVWLSEDRRYLFLNDELDEYDTGSRTHLRVFDVSDLDAIALAAEYDAPTLSIDHNNYVHGRWLYQTNYTAGLRILDIADPLNPVEAAYFDTQPARDATVFEGTWSNYRFASGRTLLSDIEDGLFVVMPRIADQGGTDLNLSLESVGVPESPSVQLNLSNAGSDDAYDVLMTAHLPRGEAWSLIDAPGAADCSPVGRVVQCRLASIQAGESLSFLLNIEINGLYTRLPAVAMAYADSADPSPADNLAKADIESYAGDEVREAGDDGGALPSLILCLFGLARWVRRRRLFPIQSKAG